MQTHRSFIVNLKNASSIDKSQNPWTISFFGSEAVHWESDGGLTFEMGPSDKDTVGTRIILHLNEDSYEFANEYRVREVLDKYCSFMPVEIFLSKANAEPEYETIDEADLKDDDEVIEHIHEDAKMEEKENENDERYVRLWE